MKNSLLMLLFTVLSSAPALADVYAHVDASGTTRFSTVPAEGFTLYFRDVAATATPSFVPPPAPAAPPTPPTMTWQDSAPYASHIRAAATATNVDAALINAVILVESGHNPTARSSAGAVGLMQLMPDTARRYNVKNRLDPEQNIRGGASYLRDLLVMFNNNLQLVLAAYNAGEQTVIKYGNRIPPYRETVAYVPKVLAYYKKFSAPDTVAAPVPAQIRPGDWRSRLPQARVRQSFLPGRAAEVAATASPAILPELE